VRRLLDEPPAWRFHANVRLGETGHRSVHFWLPGEGAARGLEAEQCIEVSDVPANSLREVPETAPTSVPASQPLALAVRYQWSVVPPRVPAGAEEDPLVGRWRKLDEDWSNRLGRVREALFFAEDERGRIGRVFSRLVSAMLGFQRAHGGLLTRVEALEEGPLPSAAGPSGTPALLSKLVEIEATARKLQTDLESAEHRAREDEERDKQRAAWQSRVDTAKRDLPDRRAALTAAEKRRSTIADELRGVEESLKSVGKEDKKDLAAKQRKLSDDLQRANKEITRVDNEIVALEQQVAEPFAFRPPPAPIDRQAPAGQRFVPSASSTRATTHVPDEALPEVGSLRSQKGQRFLIIQTWDQLTAGEQAASRLSAKLVAPENA
jgi:hypothetical protein